MNAIEVNNLSKKFYPPKGLKKLIAKSPLEQEVVAVDQVSFTAKKGEVLALVGPNGAGKTTLIKMLCTLLWPTSGSVTINGYDLMREEEKVRTLIGFVSGEERSFFWRLTGRENLKFFVSLHGVTGSNADKKVDEVLDTVELSEAANNMFYSYSSGMKQKLAIARALLSKPWILLLDELTKSLDAVTSRNLWRRLRKMAKDTGLTIVFASHQLAEVEKVCDCILVMKQGKNRFFGTMDQFERAVTKGKRYALQLSGIPHEVIRHHLLSYSGLTNISIDTKKQENLVSVEFTSSNGDSILTGVIRNVLNTGAEIHSCHKKETSLEDLYFQQIQEVSN